MAIGSLLEGLAATRDMMPPARIVNKLLLNVFASIYSSVRCNPTECRSHDEGAETRLNGSFVIRSCTAEILVPAVHELMSVSQAAVAYFLGPCRQDVLATGTIELAIFDEGTST